MVIDPGPPAAQIIAAAESGGGRITGVIATHGHFDHIAAASEVCEHAGVALFVSAADSAIMRAANLHSFVTGWAQPVQYPSNWEDLDQLGLAPTIGGLAFRVVSTPGHTPGSRCIIFENAVMTGDTISARGRIETGLPGEDLCDLNDSLALLRKILDSAMQIFPGHGDGCTLGEALNFV